MSGYLLLSLCGVLFFALIEAPLFTVIIGISMVCLYAIDLDFMAFQTIIIEMNRLASMPVLVALPLFTFTGCLLTATGAPRRVMNFIQSIAGWLPGGLAISALCSCALFTALTGASGVTIVALGGILYPVLLEKGYSEKFSLGLLTTSGSRGLLFPPSLPIILYGVVARVDIGVIFKAALAPGLFIIFVLALYIVWHEWRKPADETRKKKPVSFAEIKHTFLESKWDWPILLIILGGVYGGFVTIAEVSALVLLYVLIVECFILKEVSFFKQLPKIVIEGTLLSGAIIIILGAALGLTGYLVDEQIPEKILEFLTSLTENRYVFLAGLNLFLLAVGCMMDIFSAIVIVVPIMVPVALTYGIDPIHLCIIFLVNLEIGYSTPPVGINLFIASLKFEKPVTLLYRASVPWLVLLLVLLAIVTYVPALSLFAL